MPGVLAWAVHEQSWPDGVPGVRRRHFSPRIVGLRLPGVLTWSVQQRDSRNYVPGVLAWTAHEHSWPDDLPGIVASALFKAHRRPPFAWRAHLVYTTARLPRLRARRAHLESSRARPR